METRKAMLGRGDGYPELRTNRVAYCKALSNAELRAYRNADRRAFRNAELCANGSSLLCAQ